MKPDLYLYGERRPFIPLRLFKAANDTRGNIPDALESIPGIVGEGDRDAGDKGRVHDILTATGGANNRA